MAYLINTEKMIKQILEKLETIETLLKDQYKQPLTLEEASIYLRVSKSYLYKMTCQSTLPYYKPNGKKYILKKMNLMNGYLNIELSPVRISKKKLMNI